MLNREYWRTLCPRLNIDRKLQAHANLNPCSPEKWRQEKSRLDYDGHFVFEKIFAADSLTEIRATIEDLSAHGVPAIFVSLFDEFWEMVHALRPIGQALLGEEYQIFPDYWVWHIDHRKSQAGWRPHREAVINVPDPDYPTESLSLWVALSDATTENGCMYVLPKSKDKGYPHTIKFDIGTLQHVKALPVPAGSVIGWNQSVFHWGSSNSREATGPRISFAMELCPISQKRDIPLMMKSDHLPSFEERLRLVAMQFVNYKHLHGLEAHPEITAFVDTVLGKDYAPR
jgi:hypothetical protein